MTRTEFPARFAVNQGFGLTVLLAFGNSIYYNSFYGITSFIVKNR